MTHIAIDSPATASAILPGSIVPRGTSSSTCAREPYAAWASAAASSAAGLLSDILSKRTTPGCDRIARSVSMCTTLVLVISQRMTEVGGRRSLFRMDSAKSTMACLPSLSFATTSTVFVRAATRVAAVPQWSSMAFFRYAAGWMMMGCRIPAQSIETSRSPAASGSGEAAAMVAARSIPHARAWDMSVQRRGLELLVLDTTVGARACKYAEFCLISCAPRSYLEKSEELPHVPRGTHNYMGLQTQPQEMGSSWRSMMRHLPE